MQATLRFFNVAKSKAISQFSISCGVPAGHLGRPAFEHICDIEASIAATLAACKPTTRTSGITPFTPHDINRDAAQLESYENHRFMEDWSFADWGDRALDLGHLKHATLAGRKSLGLGTSGTPSMTSNFMAHGTLSVLIRQDDYGPFLLALYALTC